MVTLPIASDALDQITMPRPRHAKETKRTRELAAEMKEPIGLSEAGALAIAGVHEALARTAQKVADTGRKLTRPTRHKRRGTSERSPST